MAPTLRDIMAGIERNLATVDIQTFDYNPNNPIVPCAMVSISSIPDYRETFTAGTYLPRFTVTVLVSAVMDREGQLALADYANPTGSNSIKTAIESDPTLGGIVHQCVVEGFEPLGLEQVAGYGYYGGEWSVLVVSAGKD